MLFVYMTDPVLKCISGQGLLTYYVIIFLNSQAEFCGRRTPQLVVAESYSIIEVTTTLFVVIGRHDCLWSKVLKVTDDYIICEHSCSSGGSMTLQCCCFIACPKFCNYVHTCAN